MVILNRLWRATFPRKLLSFLCLNDLALRSAQCKHVLPTTLKSSVIYEYLCNCDGRCVGRTSRRLQDRIKRHVPKWLQQQAKRLTRSQPLCWFDSYPKRQSRVET